MSEVLENTPTPLFEQPLKLIAHGRILERLRYICKCTDCLTAIAFSLIVVRVFYNYVLIIPAPSYHSDSQGQDPATKLLRSGYSNDSNAHCRLY